MSGMYPDVTGDDAWREPHRHPHDSSPTRPSSHALPLESESPATMHQQHDTFGFDWLSLDPINIADAQTLVDYVTMGSDQAQRFLNWSREQHQRAASLEIQLQSAQNSINTLTNELNTARTMQETLKGQLEACKRQQQPAGGFSYVQPSARPGTSFATSQYQDQGLQQRAKLSEKLPDVPVFKGEKKEYLNWRTAVRIKLAANRDRFPTAQARLQYIMSRLEGEASAQVRGYVKEHGLINVPPRDPLSITGDFEDLLWSLEQAFGDPNRRETALRELYELKQTNKPFSWYAAKYQRLCTELDMSPEGRKAEFWYGLSQELKKGLFAVATTIRAMPFHQMVSHIQQIDNERLWAERRPTRYAYPSESSLQSLPTQPTPTTSTPAVSAPTPTTGGEPMDLSAISTRPVPPKPRHLTQEQYQQRLQTGSCFSCGATGHRRAQCPQRRNDGSFIKLNTTGVDEDQHTNSDEEN